MKPADDIPVSAHVIGDVGTAEQSTQRPVGDKAEAEVQRRPAFGESSGSNPLKLSSFESISSSRPIRQIPYRNLCYQPVRVSCWRRIPKPTNSRSIKRGDGIGTGRRRSAGAIQQHRLNRSPPDPKAVVPRRR